MRYLYELDNGRLQTAVQGFAAGVPWKTLPVYFGVAALWGAFGFLALTVLSEHGGTQSEARQLADAIQLASYTFLAVPLVYGLIGSGRALCGGRK